MMVGFGIMGYLLKKVGFEPGPIVLGLILGSIAETGLVQSMLIGQAKGGIWMVFLNRPITLLLIGFCPISLGSSWWMLRSGRRERREKKGVEGRNGGDLWVSLGFILVAVIALGHLRGLNKMSAIFPGTVGGSFSSSESSACSKACLAEGNRQRRGWLQSFPCGWYP